jgi:hypothetical protein
MSIRSLFDYTQPLVAAATIVVFGGIVLGIVGGYTAYQIKVADDTIEVTGSAKEAVTADFARWTINLETKVGPGAQQVGLDRLEAAVDQITAHLTQLGYTDFETPVANVWATYSYPEKSEAIHTGFNVSRSVIVRSPNIEAISELAGNLAPFTGSGYNVTTGGLELTYQKLDEMRVKLLSQAIADAKARAESIAKESGRDVGMLRSATSGVVQVLSRGGVDISDYGAYDTMSKEKEVMVTVRANFTLR